MFQNGFPRGYWCDVCKTPFMMSQYHASTAYKSELLSSGVNLTNFSHFPAFNILLSCTLCVLIPKCFTKARCKAGLCARLMTRISENRGKEIQRPSKVSFSRETRQGLQELFFGYDFLCFF